MDSDSRSYLIISAVLLLLAFLFALTETAISSASRTKLRTGAERGDRSARKALYVLDHFSSAVTTLLICTNIVHILMASLVTTMVTRKWGLNAVSLSTVLTTVVVFFAGEMLPKTISKKRPEFFAMETAGVLMVLMKIFAPLSGILTGIGNFVSARISGEAEVSVTEEEIQDIIEDYTEDGKMDEEQAELLTQALSFEKKKAADIMTVTEEIRAIDDSWSDREKFDFIRNENHSRIPVCHGSIDNITGMLSVRKYFLSWYRTGGFPATKSFIYKVYYADPETDIDDLLEKMSAAKVTMAVVREKDSGATLGIITIEDILEELVGDIYDENDPVKGESV